MLKRPLQLGQLGALYWLCSSSALASCESQRHASEAPATGDQLKLVQAVLRHGARTPLTDKFWPDAGAKFETGTVCGELLSQKSNIAIRNAADGGPQPFARHDAVQVLGVASSQPSLDHCNAVSVYSTAPQGAMSVRGRSASWRIMLPNRLRACCREAAPRAS